MSSVDALLISLRGFVAPGVSGLQLMTGDDPDPGVWVSMYPVFGDDTVNDDCALLALLFPQYTQRVSAAAVDAA